MLGEQDFSEDINRFAVGTKYRIRGINENVSVNNTIGEYIKIEYTEDGKPYAWRFSVLSHGVPQYRPQVYGDTIICFYAVDQYFITEED